MTLSLSLSVRPFVRPSVRTLFFLLMSLKFLLVLKSFNGVSRLFNGCLKEVSRMFQGSKRVFQESFKVVSRKFHRSYPNIMGACLHESLPINVFHTRIIIRIVHLCNFTFFVQYIGQSCSRNHL